MEYLNDYITRENLESEPGVIDQEKVRALRINLYLAYIDGCVELGGYEFPNIAAEMIEDVMLEEFCSYTHMLEGRYPELEEIKDHLRRPENVEVRKNWTEILTHANKDNWPETVRRFREELHVPEDVPIKNEERVRALMEKAANERTWTIKEL